MIVVSILLLILGFVMLIKGADWLVGGASGIALKFGIPKLVIALTIIAIGTSAPEAAVSISGALKGDAGISIGNVVGSNILNILIILGICAVIGVISVAKSTMRYEIPFLLGVTVVFILMGLDGSINIIDAIILLALFAAYLVYIFTVARKQGGAADEAEDESEKKEKKIWQLLLLLGIGLTLVIWGADIAVDAATEIARACGISDRFIGLTIVAFGTSLPELITSITAVRKGEHDIAIGNIVGSNIFNLIFILGVSGVITTIPFEHKFIIDAIISAGAALLLWLFCLKDRKLHRWNGIVFLAAYSGYFIYLCVS